MGKLSVGPDFKVGERARVIVDVNPATGSRNPDDRHYSIKLKFDRAGKGKKNWYRVATVNRIVMKNVRFVVKEEGSSSRQWVLANKQKAVHAFIEGDIIAINLPDMDHEILLGHKESAAGDRHVSYDPYKTMNFVTSSFEHLPSSCANLEQAQGGVALYCYESSILYDI